MVAIASPFSREKAGRMRASVAEACSSWSNLKLALQVKNTLGESQSHLEPTPAEKRTWDFKTYCLFYFGISFGNWTLGSTMIGIGLNWWQSIVVIFVSQTIASIAMAFNSRAASRYHLGYPAISRAVFGMYGSYYFVGARAVLAAVWYGIQLYSGANHVGNMLRAVFGDSYNNIPNHIPESAGITTKAMLSFILFWLVHLVFCFFRPYQLKKFFWFKGFIMLPAVAGVFIYCMIESGGKISNTLAQSSVTGGLGWAIMHGINSGMGNTATLITNQPDIARWAKSPRASVVSQVMVQPLAVTLSATFGILATAGINGKWGLELWNPWDLLDAIQDHHNGSGARFAIFLAALCWTISILGTNIAANMISFGSDAALLWPRYIDMKRGFFIAQILGYAIVPWKILASATVFTTFLSGYGLFMASVVAIMIADYFVLTRGNIATAWLFNPKKTNIHFRYHRGWNIQAVIAYLAGIALPFPGFAASLGASGVNQAGNDLFYLGWLLSFSTALVVYIVLCKLWPTKNQKLIRDRNMGWEEYASVQIEDDSSSSAQEMGVSHFVVGDESSKKIAG
ncbi:putative Allantoin permease [Seiridium unicorne]|uniref:Allantoin permease n=1 Tax=Seiridium unicorne TaxID=138068 RepID=A0ABR2UG93_9PEZI